MKDYTPGTVVQHNGHRVEKMQRTIIYDMSSINTLSMSLGGGHTFPRTVRVRYWTHSVQVFKGN